MLWFLLISVLIVLDQWTKWYFFTNQQVFNRVEVIKDFFYFTYLENRGASFGILQNFRYTFIIITIIAVIVMIFYFKKNRNTILRLSLALIMGGAIGNFIDRLFRGFVVDFLDFYPFGYDFPIFNLADVWINIGVGFLIIYIIFIYKEPDKEINEKIYNDVEVKDEEGN